MQHDRTIDRDALRGFLPDDLHPLVDLLPGCNDCGDVHIDTSVNALLFVIQAMIASQNEEWRAGAIASCKRVLDCNVELIRQ